MKVKVSEAIGPALDWMVAYAQGSMAPLGNVQIRKGKLYITVGSYIDEMEFAPSTDGSQGGPIIEREKISTRFNCKQANTWEAYVWAPSQHDLSESDCNAFTSFGPTALIAAMRCKVASKLGDEVDVPEELE